MITLRPSRSPTTVTVLFENVPAAYQAGMRTSLAEAGHGVTEGASEADVAVVGLRGPDACSRIDELANAGLRVVTLLEPFAEEDVAHALHHRAAPADWNSSPAELTSVIEQAAVGKIVVPIAFAGTMISPPHRFHAATPSLTREEQAWLRDLSRGETVIRIADEYGYSERAMFRRLHDLYGRLGASGRAQALVTAERLGLLDS